MPKELFFRIPDEKQNRVIDAALMEFSDKVYNDASINQIIQVANISRGSFYKYFEDKEDLYFYIINKVIKSTAYAFMNGFMETQPKNIFLVYRELFNYNLLMMSDKKYEAFFKNIYLSINYQFQQKLKMIFSKIRNDMFSDKASNIIKESRYEEKYIIELANILELINRDLLTMKIANKLNDERIMEIYDLRIKVLCNINIKEISNYV